MSRAYLDERAADLGSSVRVLVEGSANCECIAEQAEAVHWTKFVMLR